ncbi:hypothetical protein ABPG75_001130 [Micractinium tetrahymenae]
MLLRSLLAGLRAASGSGLSAASSRAAPLVLPAASTASAATATATAFALPRGLATLCSSWSSLSSLTGARCAAQLGSAASRTALGSSSGSVWSAAAAGARSSGSSAAPHQLLQQRPRTTSSHLKVKFAGGKIKSYSSYKSRFRVTGSGKVLYARPGHVHKRFSKSKRQLFDLSHYQALTPRYAKTVKKIGFKLRKF